jgi:RNA polymerase sigma-70 factor (ECF subfamily)
MNDQQLRLVQRIQSGDAGAARELFSRYQKPILWKISRAIQTDTANLNDVAGEVYLALIESLRKESFRPEGWQSLDAFVWGVTNNKIRDWFKKQKRDRRVFENDPIAAQVVAAVEDYRLENEEITQILKTSLNRLKPRYREVLDLRYFKEMSIPEIGAQLGLPPRRVSERIHYALKLLRKASQKKEASILGLLLLLYAWR